MSAESTDKEKASLEQIVPGDGRIPWMQLFILVLGTFMAVLDGSIVNVALPKLMAIFNTSTDEIQWVMTIYLLVGGVVIPVSGYLGDRFGNRKIYLISIVLFTLSSLLCGLSWNARSLIVARAIQAIGGGMIMPVTMTILYYIVPKDKMGMALGVYGLTMTMAPAIGPTLGGYLVEYFSWKLIFYINLPIGVLTVLMILAYMKEIPFRPSRFDMVGFALCGIACFTVLLALSEGTDKGWGSQYIVTLFVIALFSFALFAIWELFFPEPMIDIRLFKNMVLTASIVSSSLVAVAMFTGIFLVPLFCQNILGYSAMQTGMIIMPMAIASGLVMPISGRLYDKVGALPLGLAGLALVVVNQLLLSRVTAQTPIEYLRLLLVMRGIGMGLSMMPITTAGISSVAPNVAGRASSLINVVRQVAASFGVAITTYIFANRLAFHTERMLEQVTVSSPAHLWGLGQVRAMLALSGTGGMSADTAYQVVVSSLVSKSAAAYAIGDAFLISMVIIVFALPPLFLLRKRRRGENVEAGTPVAIE